MDKFLGQDIDEKDRWNFLLDNSDGIEEIGYAPRTTNPNKDGKEKNDNRRIPQNAGFSKTKKETEAQGTRFTGLFRQMVQLSSPGT